MIQNIDLPRSKSILIRQLIYHYISTQQLLDITERDAEDVQIVYRNLKVISSNKNRFTRTTINVDDCGTAYRFLLAVLVVSKGKWFLTGCPTLLARPMNAFIKTLQEVGADIKKCPTGLKISGKKMTAEKIKIDCSDSSQFASALYLIGNKIGLKQLIIYPHNFSSSSFVNMTLKTVEKMKKTNLQALSTERDWSAAVYWYARAVLETDKSFHFSQLQLDSLQEDHVIAEWFKEWGVETTVDKDGLSIHCSTTKEHNQHRKIMLHIKNNLDLVPVLACLAAVLPCNIIFKGIKNLKFKESNRTNVIIKELSSFAAITVPDEDTLCIDGYDYADYKTENLHFDSHHDHRFVMGFTLFSIFGEVTINDKECVKKSYPFFCTDSAL